MSEAVRCDVLVIGGGLAGAAAAMSLARAGRDVVLMERDAQARDKVCGEFLSEEALQLLESLMEPVGETPATMGALPIRSVRLWDRRTSMAAEARLPFRAMSLTRRRLDDALLAAAAKTGVEVRRGVAVERLSGGERGWQALCTGEQEIRAEQVVLATGKHDLRGYPRPRGRQSDLVAMKMYWRLAEAQQRALGSTVELHVHPGGYTGLQPVQGEAANLCCLVQRGTLAQLGGNWPSLLQHLRRSSPALEMRLHGAEPLLPRPLAISAIPYGFVRRRAMGDRLWAVGDQAAVIPSFTGDGMSIALYSGLRAAESILGGEDAARFQARLGHDLRWQVEGATALSRGLVYGPTQRTLTAAARLWPGVLRTVARYTRLPEVPLPAVALQGRPSA